MKTQSKICIMPRNQTLKIFTFLMSVQLKSYQLGFVPWGKLHVMFEKHRLNSQNIKLVSIIVGSTNRASSQQLQMWFLNIFSRQNLLRCLSRLLFLLRRNKSGAKRCLKNHIPFNFRDDSTLANQGAGKTIEKPLKELPWNQQFRLSC